MPAPLRRIGWFLVCCFALAAQAQSPPAEMSSHDEAATFKTRVNLVLVPVVVRDRQGKAIGTLKQEDFQLFDRGKPQIITKFSLEKSAAPAKAMTVPAPAPDAAAGTSPAGAAPLAPERFVAYLFDDVHINFGDLARARDAAGRHMDKLAATHRAAIYTTSGQTMLEFTDDRDKLHNALLQLRPRPIARSGVQQCPDISYYMADMIQNKNDPMALQAAVAEASSCGMGGNGASNLVQGMASQVLAEGDQETRVSLSVLSQIVRRLSAMPGQRALIILSPGFLTLPDVQQDKTDIMDRAIRGNVMISALDARGLYTLDGDASRATYNARAETLKRQFERDSAMADADVLAEMAAGTGGTFFQNNNDFDEGLRRIAAAPEYYYVLGFSPQNLKLDGGFHALKVTVKEQKGLTAQARRGYYAPRHLEDPAETAKREIEEALFSREEMHDIPSDLHTQFFKTGDTTAKVAVLVHLPLRPLHFQKEDGRNRDDLTVVAALFDRNGNFVTAITKKIEMRLLDQTLLQRADSGVTVRTTLDAQPGAYAVRVVLRDSNGELMSAQNGAVEIP